MAFDVTYHDDETMQKVYRALSSVGLDDKSIINAVTRMQNDGILFRETAGDKKFKMGGGIPPEEPLKGLIEEYRITEEEDAAGDAFVSRVHQIQREIDREGR